MFSIGQRVICDDKYVKGVRGTVVALYTPDSITGGVFSAGVVIDDSDHNDMWVHGLLCGMDEIQDYSSDFMEVRDNRTIRLKNGFRGRMFRNKDITALNKDYSPEQSGDTEEDI